MNITFHVDDIAEGSCREFSINDQALFVVKHDGELFAYQNRCPHLGIELNWQEHQFLDPDGVLIQCSTHGALFRIHDGHCVSGPCQGQQLTSVDITIRGNEVTLSSNASS